MKNSQRLTFEILNEDNQNLVYDLYQDPENIEFLQGINAEKDIQLSIDCFAQNQIGVYLIFENDSGNFVGVGGVQLQEPMPDGLFAIENHDIEFLIMLSNKFKGKGYASEFCQSFFQEFYIIYPSKIIPARVKEENIACVKLLEKFGFKKSGKTFYNNYNNEFLLLLNDNISHEQSR